MRHLLLPALIISLTWMRASKMGPKSDVSDPAKTNTNSYSAVKNSSSKTSHFINNNSKNLKINYTPDKPLIIGDLVSGFDQTSPILSDKANKIAKNVYSKSVLNIANNVALAQHSRGHFNNNEEDGQANSMCRRKQRRDTCQQPADVSVEDSRVPRPSFHGLKYSSSGSAKQASLGASSWMPLTSVGGNGLAGQSDSTSGPKSSHEEGSQLMRLTKPSQQHSSSQQSSVIHAPNNECYYRVSQHPQHSSQYPRVSSQHLQHSSQHSQQSSQHSQQSSQHSQHSSQQPQHYSQYPRDSCQHFQDSSQHLQYFSQHPQHSNQHPHHSNQHPQYVFQSHSSGVQRSSYSSQKFASAGKQVTAATYQYPLEIGHCTSSQQFGTSSQQFGTSSQQFGTSSQQFGTSSQQFGTTSQQFGTTSQQFGTTSQQFGTTSQQFGTTSQQFGTTSQQFGTTSQQAAISPSSQQHTSTQSSQECMPSIAHIRQYSPSSTSGDILYSSSQRYAPPNQALSPILEDKPSKSFYSSIYSNNHPPKSDRNHCRNSCNPNSSSSPICHPTVQSVHKTSPDGPDQLYFGHRPSDAKNVSKASLCHQYQPFSVPATKCGAGASTFNYIGTIQPIPPDASCQSQFVKPSQSSSHNNSVASSHDPSNCKTYQSRSQFDNSRRDSTVETTCHSTCQSTHTTHETTSLGSSSSRIDEPSPPPRSLLYPPHNNARRLVPGTAQYCSGPSISHYMAPKEEVLGPANTGQTSNCPQEEVNVEDRSTDLPIRSSAQQLLTPPTQSCSSALQTSLATTTTVAASSGKVVEKVRTVHSFGSNFEVFFCSSFFEVFFRLYFAEDEEVCHESQSWARRSARAFSFATQWLELLMFWEHFIKRLLF